MKTKTLHFKVDYEGLTRIVRDFWAEGEYTTALAIMTDSGISADNAKDVIRGKLKMAPYPKDEDQGWLVPDNWEPRYESCLWSQYPDPDDHKFFRMINHYGIKPLSEARNIIELIENQLRCTSYWPDKVRLIEYLRKEQKYPDEIYEFFNLPFPESIKVDCKPEDMLPYDNPWSEANFRKLDEELKEKKENDAILGGKIPGATGLITMSGSIYKKDEVKPKKSQFVLDNEKIVYLEITSWVGIGIGASHYYGELKNRDKTIQLKSILTQKQAAKLNRNSGYRDFKKGDETTGFDSQELLIKEALKQFKLEFPQSTLLIEGRNSVSGPQPIIEGPEELKVIVNPLAERADQIDWYTYKKHEAEMEELDQQWKQAMLKFGYAKELQI